MDELILYVQLCPKGHLNRRIGYMAPIKQKCDVCGAFVAYEDPIEDTKAKGIQDPFCTRITFDTDHVLETLWNITYLRASFDHTRRSIGIYTDSIMPTHPDDYGYAHELYTPAFNGNINSLGGGSWVYLRNVANFPNGLSDDEVIAMFARKNITVKRGGRKPT